METASVVLCVLGAIVGAGFASGREILQFFSRYGPFSWALVVLAALTVMGLVARVMRRGRGGIEGILPEGKLKGLGEALLAALLLSTGGGMAAAAGELAALTVPLRHARSLGMLLTLTGCLALSRQPLRAMEHLGRLLLPVLIIAFLLCFRVRGGGTEVPMPSVGECALGCVQALSYAGMNVTLAAGILCDTGARCGARGICRGAAWAGGAIGALLALGNGMLLPNAAALGDAALPVVELLRAYGKVGYYLAAAALYLAVTTTLIAVLRALRAVLEARISRFLFPVMWAATALVALCGFERIVAFSYPVLGFFCFCVLVFPEKKGRNRKNVRPNPFVSSHSVSAEDQRASRVYTRMR